MLGCTCGTGIRAVLVLAGCSFVKRKCPKEILFMFSFDEKQFTDEEMVEMVKALKSEYRDWRIEKARNYLAQKNRDKFYYCMVNYETIGDFEEYLKIPSDIIANYRALKIKIANDPELKNDSERSDALHDAVMELGTHIYLDLSNRMGGDWCYTDINPDKYIYKYRFDICYFNNEGQNRIWPEFISLSDDDYVQLLAHLIEYNTCSFNKLAIDMPEIYSKILDSLSYCNETTYAVLMSEANNDAVAIRDYLEKKGEKFHSIDFLHSMYAAISDCIERKHPENNNLNFKLNTVKL